ncbi:MAG: Wzz/FepE/Etk N-terminal domain-containing protein [Terracidiphilus sp.]|jgi:capsule polysaccharide export protein KpsE/RkpR
MGVSVKQAELLSPEVSELSGMLVFLMRTLWLRRYWLGRLTVAGLLITAVIAFLIPKQYQSTVKLMPPDPLSLSGGAMATLAGATAPSGPAGLASALFGGKSTGETFVGILQSRTAEDDLISRFNLLGVYRTNRYIDARKKLIARTKIEEDTKSGIITIIVTDNDPHRARDIAGAYVEELNKLVNKLSTSSARRERLFLEDRLKAVKADLDGASQALSQFSSRNATFDVQNQGAVMIGAASRLQGELIAAESELHGLEAAYAFSNVRVQEARARVDELQRQLQTMSGTGQTPEEDGPRTNQLYPSLRKLPLLGATYSDLYRRTKICESTYETLTREYELAKVQEAKEIPSVSVLDEPVVPESKSFPPRLAILLLGTVLTFVAGCAWAAGKEWWHVLDEDHVAKRLVRTVRYSRLTQGPEIHESLEQ